MRTPRIDRMQCIEARDVDGSEHRMGGRTRPRAPGLVLVEEP